MMLIIRSASRNTTLLEGIILPAQSVISIPSGVVGKSDHPITNNGYIHSINHFRGIAILMVVAGHCFGLAGLKISGSFEKVVVNLLSGGTVLFVFISGFLFHHIFYRKYQYAIFIAGKVKNILIPYILLGALPVYFYISQKKDARVFFMAQGSGFLNEYVIPAFKYYGTGSFLTAYWYVPFILATFMLSPLHFLFARTRSALQFGLIAILCVIALLIHRPVDNFNLIQSVVYFTPVYLIGIVSSLYKEKIYSTLAGKESTLLAIILLLAVLQAAMGFVGNYHKMPFVYGGLDIMFAQKISMCMFFLVYLKNFESSANPYLNALATTSFTVYFLHPIIIWVAKRGLSKYLATDSWIVFALCVISVVIFCVAIAKLMKLIIPRYSRYMVGY